MSLYIYMQMHIHLYIYTYICGVRVCVCVYMYSILSAHMAKSRVQYCLRDAVHLKERQQSSAASNDTVSCQFSTHSRSCPEPRLDRQLSNKDDDSRSRGLGSVMYMRCALKQHWRALKARCLQGISERAVSRTRRQRVT